MIQRVAPHVLLCVLVGLFVFTGKRGLDYGFHWDEPFAVEEVIRPLENGVFLPGSYNYPSVVFDIGTLALLPRTVPFLTRVGKDSTPYYSQPYQELVPKGRVAQLVAYAKSHEFLLTLRTIFLFLTVLTGLWVYLAVHACQRSNWEALFAAAIVLTSWEVAYHARWIAPDAIQMQFAALWIMTFAFALHSVARPWLWIRLSAVAAGLACGTKYQGGILLLPVLIYAGVFTWRSAPPNRLWVIIKELLVIGGIFFASFVATTPGALLQPLSFVQSVRHVSHQYATGHGTHTVGAFGEHGYRLFVYVTCALASHWPVIAVILSATAAFGAVMAWKERPIVAALFLLSPIAYTLYIVCYRVMIARNYLLIAPFFAIFAARGAFHIWKILEKAPWARRALVTAFVLIFAIQGIFLWRASQTIRAQLAGMGENISAYLKKHPNTKYLVSSHVMGALVGDGIRLDNVTTDPTAAERYLLHTYDGDRIKYACNRLGDYRQVAGPLEVNFDYYGDWQGFPRVVDLSIKRAREMKLLGNP